MEDVVEFGSAGEEIVEHLLAGLAEVLRHPVEELGMADLVLDLARQRELPAESWRAEDPVTLGQHPPELAVGVHLDELQARRPRSEEHTSELQSLMRNSD